MHPGHHNTDAALAYAAHGRHQDKGRQYFKVVLMVTMLVASLVAIGFSTAKYANNEKALDANYASVPNLPFPPFLLCAINTPQVVAPINVTSCTTPHPQTETCTIERCPQETTDPQLRRLCRQAIKNPEDPCIVINRYSNITSGDTAFDYLTIFLTVPHFPLNFSSHIRILIDPEPARSDFFVLAPVNFRSVIFLTKQVEYFNLLPDEDNNFTRWTTTAYTLPILPFDNETDRVQLSIGVATPVVLSLREVKTYPLVQYLADIGGWLGLFSGLALFHFLFFIPIFLWDKSFVLFRKAPSSKRLDRLDSNNNNNNNNINNINDSNSNIPSNVMSLRNDFLQPSQPYGPMPYGMQPGAAYYDNSTGMYYTESGQPQVPNAYPPPVPPPVPQEPDQQQL